MRVSALIVLAALAPRASAQPPVEFAPARASAGDAVAAGAGDKGRGLPRCQGLVAGQGECQSADTSLPAPFSNAAPLSFRTLENFRPLTSGPDRICWVGRYSGRFEPAAADESFRIRIFADEGGMPDLESGAVFDRVFVQSGVSGVNELELDCLNGQNCPGTPSPPSGGHYVFSAAVDDGLPLVGGECYWIEIANLGSSLLGQNWAWVASGSGSDDLHLQAVDGAYTPYSYRAGDLSLCVEGGLATGAAGCVLTVPPPVCQNDPANGQPYDGELLQGLRASSQGSVGLETGPGAWSPTQRAEDFQVGTAVEVTGVCFWGFWLGITDTGQQVPINAPAAPAFDIVYYVDAGGVPGLPLPVASFRVGTTEGVELTWDGNDAASVTHPPVAFYPGTCYWVSIGRVQEQQGLGEPVAPLWHWRLTTLASGGNGHLASRPSSEAGAAWSSFTCTLNCDIVNLSFVLSAGPAGSSACFPAMLVDCNGNGVPDPTEIALDPGLDCFNPNATGSVGGPDGALDACQCVADWGGGGGDGVNSNDISAYLTSWLAAVAASSAGADTDCSGVTDSADISAFLEAWLAATADAVGHDGCP